VLLLFAELQSDRHVNPPGHPERPERVRSVCEGICLAGCADALVNAPARPASKEELAMVHDPSYVSHIEEICSEGGGMVDPDTWASPESFETARLAAGAGLAAIELLRQGSGDAALVAMRPPGHHARPSGGMGFCLFNNVAVAAADLASRGERVLIFDWDVHHGNGTQEIFFNDRRVLYLSVHQSPLYPGTGAATETGGPDAPGLTVNIPLPPGTTGDVVRRGLDEVAAPVIDRFKPDWVLVSAGFDAHRDDPLASLMLTAGDFFDLAKWAKGWAPRPGRIALFLEGGYDLGALRLSAGATVASLVGVDYRPEPASFGGPGADAVQRAADVFRASVN